MKSVSCVVIVLMVCQQAVTDFDCQEITDYSRGTCQRELQCAYDEGYEEREGYSKYCPCRAVINDLPLPNNILQYSKFEKTCSLHKTRLMHLWVIDANLEFIEGDIFANYPNLRYLNLAGNHLRLNFSNLAENITELDVSNNGLNLIQADALDSLKSLKMINVSFNRLEKLNYCFKKLKFLEEVYLNNNHLLRISKDEFVHLENLRVLNLAHNLLTSIDPNLVLLNLQELYLNNNELMSLKYQHLPNLRILKIGYNLISNLSELNRFDNLEELYLENNTVKLIDTDLLGKLSNLKLLNMSNNGIIDVRGYGYNSFPDKLQIIDLSSNIFYYIPFYNLQNLALLNMNRNRLELHCYSFPEFFNLRELYLEHNSIVEIPECTFRNLGNLSKLSLQANYLREIEPGTFDNLNKLRELNLAENMIGHISRNIFDDLSELRALNISHNKLTNFDLNTLNKNNKITSFDIKDNLLDSLDLRLLRDKLPALQVVDFNVNLVRCDTYGDILRYFDENSVIFKRCPSADDCCSDSDSGISRKLPFIIAGVIASCIFAIIGLFAVMRNVCKCKCTTLSVRRTETVNLVPIHT